MILRKVYSWAYEDNGTIKLYYPVSDHNCCNPLKEYYYSEEDAVSAYEKYKLENEWGSPHKLFLLEQYRAFQFVEYIAICQLVWYNRCLPLKKEE